MQSALDETPVQDKTEDPILSPLDGSGVGEDPRYSDEFVFIRNEIDKLSKNDYAEIAVACRKILTSESKDLRVAGYLILAETFTDGVAGLVGAAKIYLGLLEKYGSDCHPQRSIAQQQAFAWLNNDKLPVFLGEAIARARPSYELLSELRGTIDRMNALAEQYHGSEISRWTILDSLLERTLKSLKPAGDESAPAKPAQVSVKETAEISSELGLNKAAGEMIRYLQEREDWLRAVAVSRAIRWTTVALPAHVDGQTKVPAPRESVRLQLSGAVEREDCKILLQLCEQCFQDPGGQYWLDLQYHAVQAARGIDMPELAALIEEQTRALVKRVPELTNLVYDDGTPFAGNKTRRWLSQNRMKLARETEQADKSATPPAAESFSGRLNLLLEETSAAEIPVILERLSTLFTRSDYERFCLDLARVDVCISADRSDLALPLAESLARRVEEFSLARWEPSLAIKVWERLRELLCERDASASANEPDSRISVLEARICETDVSAAMRII